ncbi:PTPN2 [Bugula neritina]|uniref:protein-tyrosine-phosphatase n=1 Tax=Bugula neritina TaxID=10212 RepID=A0A7J7JHR6_BUGNE|nr:PTPN2 [Bugula neritina]
MGSLIEEEYETYTHERKWKQVYDVIQSEAYVLHNSSSQLAKLPENRSRNRYRDVSPYDDYRVVLNDSVNNYINASRIEVPLSKRSYILTQGVWPPGYTLQCWYWSFWHFHSRRLGFSPGDEEISDVDSDDTDILLQHNGDVEEELKDADVEESLFVDTSPLPDAEPDTEPSAEPGPEPSAEPGPEPDVVEDQHTVPKAQETAPSIEVNKDIPDPPKRTSSLNKAASLDEHPPPVPPRPPSNFDRQKSAPPVPEEGSSSSQSLRDNSEEDGYYENISSKPIAISKNPMKRKREEAVKKTREKIEMMRAKQRAAEEAKNRRDVFPSRRVMIGAGLTIAFAIGVMYCVRSYGL